MTDANFRQLYKEQYFKFLSGADNLDDIVDLQKVGESMFMLNMDVLNDQLKKEYYKALKEFNEVVGDE